jgi:TatD DNase family protein
MTVFYGRRWQMQRFVQASQHELVDSHVHLDRYTDEEVKRMVSWAAAAGVRELLTIGTNLATSRAGLRLARRYPSVRAAVGIHPTQLGGPASAGDAALQQLRGLLTAGATDPRMIRPAALGEVGLDDGAPDLPAQARFLAAVLVLAAEFSLPLVLHVMGGPATHEAAVQLVQQQPGVRVVAHYFVGGPDLARHYLAAGCWLSVGRPVTRHSEAAVRAAVPTIPPDRLLLETDTYPLPGRSTEPRDVTTVCAAVAELRGEQYAEVAQATTASYRTWLLGDG